MEWRVERRSVVTETPIGRGQEVPSKNAGGGLITVPTSNGRCPSNDQTATHTKSHRSVVDHTVSTPNLVGKVVGPDRKRNRVCLRVWASKIGQVRHGGFEYPSGMLSTPSGIKE